MMRRRGNKSYSRYCIPGFSYDLINLMTRELTTFTRLCSLSDFDLKLIGIDQKFGCNSKTAACNLFNCTSYTVSIFKWLEPNWVLATFAGITSSTDSVHRNCQCFMGFATDRTIR